MKIFSISLVLMMLGMIPIEVPAENKPIVAIIGTGDLGDSLGPKIAESGYRVIYGSREPARESVQTLVQLTGADASATTQQAAAEAADILILAVPWPPIEQVAQNLGDLSGKIVIDASFPYEQAEDGYMQSGVATSIAEMIQGWNPGAHVVKAGFPGSFLIDEPLALGLPPTAEIAADDRRAKEIVARIVADIGLDPFDAGPLRHARYIEAVGMLYMVPILQGRKEGIEFFHRRSSYWPCAFNISDYYQPVTDADNLAKFPDPETPPKPCSSH